MTTENRTTENRGEDRRVQEPKSKSKPAEEAAQAVTGEGEHIDPAARLADLAADLRRHLEHLEHTQSVEETGRGESL